MQDLVNKLKSLYADSDTPLLRWSVLAIALIAVWTWIIQPLHDWKRDLRAKVELDAERAARLVSLQEQGEAWKSARAAAEQALGNEVGALFTDVSDTAAQAELQRILSAMLTKHGLIVESQRFMPTEPVDGLGRELILALNLRGELHQVLVFVDEVSNHEKLLLPKRWLIRQDPRRPAISQVVVSGIRIDRQATLGD